MFSRKKKQGVVQIERQALAPAATETQVMQRMLGEFMASTALSRVQSDIGAIAADFRQFKDNIGNLNTALGEFREQAILPVKRELEYLRYNLGARTEDNVGAMSKLVHHLESQIELLLKARGINPQAVDGAGETAMDKMGLPPDRPNYQTLEREGVQLVESGDPAKDFATMQAAQIDKLRATVERLEHENTELRRLTLDAGVPGPPEAAEERSMASCATVLTGTKIAVLVGKFPDLGIDTFVHERDYNQAEKSRLALEQDNTSLRRTIDRFKRIPIQDDEHDKLWDECFAHSGEKPGCFMPPPADA